MSYLIHRGGNGRFVLQCTVTGAMAGLMFCPHPNESRRAFEYDYGSTENRESLINVNEFPELDYLTFWVMESASFYEYDRCLREEKWAHLRPLFLAEGKASGYNPGRDKPPISPSLPTRWQYTPPNPRGTWKIPAWALYVNENTVWIGNRDGLIVVLDHDGQIVNQFQLPKITRCLVGNDRSIYASCDDGNLYDLTGKLPEAVYNFRTDAVSQWIDFMVYSVDLAIDRIHIADTYGQLSQLNLDLQPLWKIQTNYHRTWFLQSDDRAVYQGHNSGVSAYDIDTGKLLWSHPTESVLCGVITEDSVIVGTSDRTLYQLSKTGDIKMKTTETKLFAELEGAAYSCTLSREKNLLFVADHLSNLYVFNLLGELIEKYTTNCGVVLNLYSFGDRLYGTTSDGTIASFSIPGLETQKFLASLKDFQSKRN
ncbi:hypothetical protein V0288_12515 [Pannus brasiliensis CCIBt3594]|uniref:Uncharacterized protein n=1 Tax=Pannus brasiliensis CCIBt3594 TaxID=1427578 RepID=A0AAW9QW91_9CHRO